MSFQVRATQPGFCGRYRETGETFEIENEQGFSPVWMEKVPVVPVDAPPPVVEGKPTKALKGK